nr:hypothetical protein [uncultured Roseibium sp.]
MRDLRSGLPPGEKAANASATVSRLSWQRKAVGALRTGRQVACCLCLAVSGFAGGGASSAAQAASSSAEPAINADEILTLCAGDTAGGVPLVAAAADGTFEGADGARYHAVDLRPLTNGARRESMQADLTTGAASYLAVPVAGPDRWGLVPAWIVRQGRDETQLFQAEILESGAALFAPDAASGECADHLRAAEHAARRARSGHWRDAAGATLFSTWEPETFAGRDGNYVIATGRVVSLGKTASTRYLNFGRYWKTDFTVTFKSSEENTFNAALGRSGHMVDDLEGHSVEVRGVLQERDGPYIALRHPEQLVVLKGRRVVSGGQDGN